PGQTLRPQPRTRRVQPSARGVQARAEGRDARAAQRCELRGARAAAREEGEGCGVRAQVQEACGRGAKRRREGGQRVREGEEVAAGEEIGCRFLYWFLFLLFPCIYMFRCTKNSSFHSVKIYTSIAKKIKIKIKINKS